MNLSWRAFGRNRTGDLQITGFVESRAPHHWAKVTDESPKIPQDPLSTQEFVRKNALASCQRCCHSVKPRALMCFFKHSDLIAWSLLRWHPTYKYLWGRFCFVQACCLLSTVTVTPAKTRIMSTEALLSKTVSVKIPRSAWAPGCRGTKQLETVATRVIAATGSFYSARGISSQASVGAAVDEERWAGKTHLPASLVLAQSEQFEASKSVGCKWGIPRAVYSIFCVLLPALCRCDHSVLEFKSFSLLINW